MFEHSLILDNDGGKKAGAFAASLMAQIVAVGVCIVVSLVFHDKLPNVRLWTGLIAPVPEAAPVAPPPVSHTVVIRRAALVPMSIPTYSALHDPKPVTIEALAPESGILFGGGAVPFGTGAVSLPSVDVPAPPPVPVVTAAPKQPQQLRVSEGVQSARILKRVIPSYPALARQARISGTVHLTGIIGKDGTVQQLMVISGHPLLVQAALDAVRQWIYRPTMLNNEPVEVIAPIDVVFTLR